MYQKNKVVLFTKNIKGPVYSLIEDYKYSLMYNIFLL